jgi:SAM-dependent methyltransferase
MTNQEIASKLQTIAKQYPPDLVEEQLHDVKRKAFDIELVYSRKGSNCRVCDLGGGVGLFSIGCAALGMDASLVDDFSDTVNERFGQSVLDLHRSYGVQIVKRDVIRDGIDFPPESLDVITSFHSMEHWHHSPKQLFSSVVRALAPGGLFILGVPNNVNLRKRITVPLGSGDWSQMSDWYEQDTFRMHVREPSVSDLKYIADDMKLVNVSIVGRNWLGHISRFKLVRKLTPFVDRGLRFFPSLCSDIYMIGTKP